VRRTAPAADRNKGPILEVLRRHVAPGARVLEIAAGTGQHTAHLAPALRAAAWQPTDPDAPSRQSIASWTAELPQVAAPLPLWTTSPWPVEGPFDLLVCINMIHISPWAATLGLLDGAQRVLADGGLLYLYGPYRREGAHTAPSNAAFDASLRQRDPSWGVRDLEVVVAQAESRGLRRLDVVEMPANNLSVLFTKA
jgi:SAM-dependent methyltransferase